MNIIIDLTKPSYPSVKMSLSEFYLRRNLIHIHETIIVADFLTNLE